MSEHDDAAFSDFVASRRVTLDKVIAERDDLRAKLKSTEDDCRIARELFAESRIPVLEGALARLVHALTENLCQALDWGTIASVRHGQAIAKEALEYAQKVLKGES